MLDLTNQTFGRWSVLERSGSNKYGQALWRCRCSCGNVIIVRGYSLRSGHTKSCGCLSRERVSVLRFKHGHCAHYQRSPEFVAWNAMKGRCSNSKHRDFRYYGGRGIKVCQRWINSFLNFLADMGQRPAGTSIDRIDNDGNYEPGNCRWATDSQQNKNRRKAV